MTTPTNQAAATLLADLRDQYAQHYEDRSGDVAALDLAIAALLRQGEAARPQAIVERDGSIAWLCVERAEAAKTGDLLYATPHPEADAVAARRERDEAIAERDSAMTDLAYLANEMVYDGNSIGWIASKAKKYGAALLRAFDALYESGYKSDGNTELCDAIRKHFADRQPAPDGMVMIERELVANVANSTQVPRFRRMCEAALAREATPPSQPAQGVVTEAHGWCVVCGHPKKYPDICGTCGSKV